MENNNKNFDRKVELLNEYTNKLTRILEEVYWTNPRGERQPLEHHHIRWEQVTNTLLTIRNGLTNNFLRYKTLPEDLQKRFRTAKDVFQFMREAIEMENKTDFLFNFPRHHKEITTLFKEFSKCA